MAARRRPGGTFAKEELTDEVQLWSSIVEKVKRAQSLNEKYEEVAGKLARSEQNVPEDDPATAITLLENMSTLHREGLKYVEEELHALNEEPDDLINNLETLIMIRTAMEAEAPTPRVERSAPQVVTQTTKPAVARNVKRKLDTIASDPPFEALIPTNNSGPVVSINLPVKPTAPPTSVQKKASRTGSMSIGKSEPLSETESTIKNVASSTQPIFAVGSEVVYRQKAKSQTTSDDGEGITCKIKEIIEPSQGKARRYKIQDAEPDEGETPAIITATSNSLVSIPTSALGLAPLAKGRQVLAKYPNTSTFYRAEVVGTGKKEMCKLRFDGEDQPGTEKEVERRYVLDIK